MSAERQAVPGTLPGFSPPFSPKPSPPCVTSSLDPPTPASWLSLASGLALQSGHRSHVSEDHKSRIKALGHHTKCLLSAGGSGIVVSVPTLFESQRLSVAKKMTGTWTIQEPIRSILVEDTPNVDMCCNAGSVGVTQGGFDPSSLKHNVRTPRGLGPDLAGEWREWPTLAIKEPAIVLSRHGGGQCEGDTCQWVEIALL
ncbi:unnamed protein product [Pleuronectes platessa]|uniref:Uncharacterized protein n=1 Tax=Pleuronectes platessa TaxID=8262 RepID=A0A9N7VQC5_PLEPL|nr:unnamed protein product [Pleuronectes platessa]